MAIRVNWSQLGLGSIVAFFVAWLIFGLFGAVLLAVVVMIMMGIIKIS